MSNECVFIDANRRTGVLPAGRTVPQHEVVISCHDGVPPALA